MPQKQGDGSLQERRPRQREHPPQEQKTFGLCLYVGYIRNHTRGFYPGITLQRTSVSSVRPWRVRVQNCYARTRNFCMFCMTFIPVPGTSVSYLCTTLIPVPGTSVSSVLPSHKHPGCGYSIYIPARNFCEFCNTSVPISGTSATSGRSSCLYPELL